MELEKQNIEMARKLLEKAMAALDNKIALLPANDNEITLAQAVDIMENYDVVNELRDIIMNQINYLEKESKEKVEARQLVQSIHSDWLKETLGKIDGEVGNLIYKESYYEHMKRLKIYFHKKMDQGAISNNDLLLIRSTINITRKGSGNRIKELFGPTDIHLSSIVKQRSQSDIVPLDDLRKMSIIQKKKELIASQTHGVTASNQLDKSATSGLNSSTQISKEKMKDEINKNLPFDMLKFSFERKNAVAHNVKEKIEWIDFVLKIFEDKKYEKEIEKIIIDEINSLLDPIKSKNMSITDKIQLLDKLVTNRKKLGEKVVEAYHHVNELLSIEIANQIIDKDREIFQKINLESFLIKNVKDKRFLEATDLLNRIARWTSEMILQSDINVRVLALSRMITVAYYCYEQGDLNGVLAIWSGIEGTCVMRLKNTYENLPDNVKDMLNDLKIKLDKSSNFKNLRKAIEEFNGPIVPFLGVYTSDIIHFGDSVPNASWFDVDAGIKSPKSIIKAIQKVQQFSQSRFSSDTSFINDIMSSTNYNKPQYEETLFNLSLKLEPKGSQLTSTISSALISKFSSPKQYGESSSETAATVLHGSKDLLLFYDELLNKKQILLHQEVQLKLLNRYSGEIREIHQHNNKKELVEVTQSEWNSLKEEMNVLAGAPILNTATQNDITIEQLQILNLYFKVRERVKIDEKSKEFSLERKIYERRQKDARYIYLDENDKDTADPLSDYYFLIDGKLYKRDLNTSHYQPGLAKQLEEYKQSEIKSEKQQQLLLVNDVTKSLSEIDNYLNLTLRQALAKPIDPAVIDCIKFIVNEKYDELILLMNSSTDNIDIKESLERDKIKFNDFCQKLEQEIKSSVKNYIVPLEEKVDTAKLLASTIALSQSSTPKTDSQDIASVKSRSELTPAISPVQSFVQELPFERTDFDLLRNMIRSTKEGISVELQLLDINEEDMEEMKSKERSEGLVSREEIHVLEKISLTRKKLADLNQALNDLERELSDKQANLVSQISFITDLMGPLNDKQAMILICNFRALLEDDYDEAVKILDKFDKDLFSRLQEKLQNFSDIDPKLNDIIGQLSMALSYLGADFKDDYKKMFEMFSDSYQALSPMMQSSKELGDYYEEINKKIEEMKLASQMISSQFPSQEILSPTGQVEVPTLSIISSDSLSIASESRKPSVESRASRESIDIEVLFTDEHRVAVIPTPDLKSQPSRIIPLLDVDMTLVMGGGKYNDELIGALIEKGITEVYLFTSYAVGGGGAGSESNLGSRNELIKYLDKKGIKVQGVIVEDDVLYNKRPGAWYEKKLRPLEIAAMEGKLDKKARDQVENLEKEMRMGILMEDYNKLTPEEQKSYEQKARNNSPNKGDMYKYVVSHFGNQHTYIFIDDDFKYNIPKVRDAAKELGSNLIAIPVTPEKKKIQFLDGMEQRRDWIKESEQYRRVFDIKDVRTKPEFKVVVKEGDLTIDQLMGYSTAYGSIFSSLTKTLWMVMNGGKSFHVPGEEKVRMTPNSNKAFVTEVKNNPNLLDADEFIYTQAVNRYAITNIENKREVHQIITTPNVYIAATASIQLDDPNLWDYRLLVIDPLQNSEENVKKLKQKANALNQKTDILHERLAYSGEIPTYAEMREDYEKKGISSRYMPLRKNKADLYIIRKPDGSYTTSKEMTAECVFIDKVAYVKAKVRELNVKMHGFDQWLISQNKEGEWRALDAGVGAFAWLGGMGPDTHAELMVLHDQAYQIVLKNHQFKKIKAIQSERNLFPEEDVGLEFKKLADNVKFNSSDPYDRYNYFCTDFSNCSVGRLMGIDACADARTPLGNEKEPHSAEPRIINASPGARAAGSPWTSPELLHPDNWIVERPDGTRVSGTEYLRGKKNISTIEEMRTLIDEKKPADIRDLELWNKNREKIFKLNDDKDYGALNIILKQFSERGRRQIADVILEKLRKDILVDKDKESLIQDMKKFIFALHGLNLKHSEKLQICEDLFVMIRDRDSKIYKAEEDENASLFENLLPAERKPALLNKQIELLKLLKDAYVDVVMDAVSSRKSQEELNAIREKLSNKKGLVDFQNSNTPVTVTTGTRKKVEQLLVTPQMTKADKELYQEITNLKIDELNKIVKGILLAQETNDIKTATKYVQEYLGRRKYGILTHNFREEFIEIAIEKGDHADNPLLKLVKNAGPELKKAIAGTEILDSHFWKGHDTSKNYISEALYKGRLTLEDFKKYRDKFADKKASELRLIKERTEILQTEIGGIKSDAIRSFFEKQIQEIKIDFLESDKFADFITKFIKPMIVALNKEYGGNKFPENYNVFYRYLTKAENKISISSEVGIVFNRKFTNAFNEAMSHQSTLVQLELYTSEFNMINVRDFSENFKEFERDVTLVLVSAQQVVKADTKVTKQALDHAERLSKQYHEYQNALIQVKEQLMPIYNYIKAIELSREDREKYKELFNTVNGVESKMVFIEDQLQKLAKINKERLQPLQRICAPAPEETSIMDSMKKSFTKLSKPSH